jgi:hypothetical protein
MYFRGKQAPPREGALGRKAQDVYFSSALIVKEIPRANRMGLGLKDGMNADYGPAQK